MGIRRQGYTDVGGRGERERKNAEVSMWNLSGPENCNNEQSTEGISMLVNIPNQV